jgi:hypothetical protein
MCKQDIQNGKKWETQRVYNPAAYAAVYNLKTVGKIAGSKSWHVYKPSMARALDVSNKEDANLYLMAQEFQNSVSKGQAKPEYEKSDKPKAEDIV